MTADRPYFDLTIIELRTMFLEHGHEIAVLGQLRTELEPRDSAGARQLLKEVVAAIEGIVRKPQKPESPWPTEQGNLPLG